MPAMTGVIGLGTRRRRPKQLIRTSPWPKTATATVLPNIFDLAGRSRANVPHIPQPYVYDSTKPCLYLDTSQALPIKSYIRCISSIIPKISATAILSAHTFGVYESHFPTNLPLHDNKTTSAQCAVANNEPWIYTRLSHARRIQSNCQPPQPHPREPHEASYGEPSREQIALFGPHFLHSRKKGEGIRPISKRAKQSPQAPIYPTLPCLPKFSSGSRRRTTARLMRCGWTRLFLNLSARN
ncbi:hypothetical protein BDW02DRAFT_118753 [Decorospora gaudefroyi]|uniref:Uncharacterized protein n=1 Tax=Decorospora gaudefroyi TaxID=184978 RepID=A0A6A5KVA4_9PLEO|nr:hypothetical protein BDW02DRAFT_118753 [Decorospora gaudefroyi]